MARTCRMSMFSLMRILCSACNRFRRLLDHSLCSNMAAPFALVGSELLDVGDNRLEHANPGRVLLDQHVQLVPLVLAAEQRLLVNVLVRDSSHNMRSKPRFTLREALNEKSSEPVASEIT